MICKFLWLTRGMRVSKNLMVVEISYNNPLRVFGKIHSKTGLVSSDGQQTVIMH